MARPLVYPLIHSNGTSGPALLEDIMQARHDLQTAIESLKACAPHGRDYYLTSSSAIDAAAAAHRSRLTDLANVLSDLDKIAIDLDRQITERAR